MPARTLLGALAIDALDEFRRAADHVPAPGQRRIGRLNAPAWSIGHLVSSADAWINVFCRQVPVDGWCDALFARQRAAAPGTAVEVDPAEARAALERFIERAGPYFESDAETLGRDAAIPQRPGGWPIVPATYMVSRFVAHAFVHAGELSVVASLVRAGDLSLPGALEASRGTVRAGDETAGALIALLRDAYGEFSRVAAALPQPAWGTGLARVSAGGFIVAHLAEQQDRTWNVALGGASSDAWLRDAGVRSGAPASAPAFADALAAWERVAAACASRLDGVASAPLDAPLDVGSRVMTVGDALTRSIAHTFAHAGELATIGSLVGMPDAGLPGALAHTMAATPRQAS